MVASAEVAMVEDSVGVMDHLQVRDIPEATAEVKASQEATVRVTPLEGVVVVVGTPVVEAELSLMVLQAEEAVTVSR